MDLYFDWFSIYVIWTHYKKIEVIWFKYWIEKIENTGNVALNTYFHHCLILKKGTCLCLYLLTAIFFFLFLKRLVWYNDAELHVYIADKMFLEFEFCFRKIWTMALASWNLSRVQANFKDRNSKMLWNMTLKFVS